MALDFLTLGVSEEIVSILTKNGITEPTPVQQQAIPALLSGKDVIAQAQTGTGKTLAFMLPIIEKVDINQSNVQALVVTPTRELAIQITAEARKLTAAKEVNILAAYGGQDVEQQIRKLKGAIHLVIGTPGRLLDHLRRKTVDFSKLKLLVLDEADQMLDMGFLKDVEQIIKQTPRKRQTMLFSATITKGVRVLSSKYINEPVQIHIQSKNITLDKIKQVVIETTDRSKQEALCKAIEEYSPFMAIIFCRTRRRVSTLNDVLQARGYKSDEIHGDITQAKREKVMKAFRQAELQFLVATDVAARGLDIEGVTHVFNYDIPEDAESYIHRIGRTGRAGQEGAAITFVASKDREFLDLIEKTIKIKIERRKIDIGKMIEDGEEQGNRKKPMSPRGSRPAGSRGRSSGKKVSDRIPGRSPNPLNSRRSTSGRKPSQRRPGK